LKFVGRNAEIVIKVASEYNNYELLYDFYYQLVKRYFTVMKYKNIIKYSELAQECYNRICTNNSTFIDKYSEIIYWKSKSLYESGKYQNALNEVSHNLAKQLKKSNCPLFINSTIVSIKAKIALIRSFKEVNSDISKALKISQVEYKQQYLEILFLKFDFLLKHNLYYDSKKTIKKIMHNTAARLNLEDNLILGKLYLKRAKMELSYIYEKEVSYNLHYKNFPKFLSKSTLSNVFIYLIMFKRAIVAYIQYKLHKLYNMINPAIDIDFSLRFYIKYYEKFPEKKLFFEIANIVIFFTEKFLYTPTKLYYLKKVLREINYRLDKFNEFNYKYKQLTHNEERTLLKYLYAVSKIKFLLEEYSSADRYFKKAQQISNKVPDGEFYQADLYYWNIILSDLKDKDKDKCFDTCCMAKAELYVNEPQQISKIIPNGENYYADLYYWHGILLNLKNEAECFDNYDNALKLFSKKHKFKLYIPEDFTIEKDIDFNLLTLFADFCSFAYTRSCSKEITECGNLVINNLDKIICFIKCPKLLFQRHLKNLKTSEILTELLNLLKVIEKEIIINNNISYAIRNTMLNKIDTLKNYKNKKYY